MAEAITHRPHPTVGSRRFPRKWLLFSALTVVALAVLAGAAQLMPGIGVGGQHAGALNGSLLDHADQTGWAIRYPASFYLESSEQELPGNSKDRGIPRALTRIIRIGRAHV